MSDVKDKIKDVSLKKNFKNLINNIKIYILIYYLTCMLFEYKSIFQYLKILIILDSQYDSWRTH